MLSVSAPWTVATGHKDAATPCTLIFALYYLRVDVVDRRWVSVSSFDWGPPHTSYSYIEQVFFIDMLSVSAPWTVATGHKDATTPWYLLSKTWEWMSWVQKVDSQSVLMIKTPHPVHTHSRSSIYIYILSVSSPSTVATGHKDVVPAWYMLPEI
jgi:hypothetical protein